MAGYLPAAAARSPPVAAGVAAPDYLGQGRDREPVSLASYAGKVVVVSFWASSCAPCRKELPVLEGLQRAGKGEIQVIAVNCGSREQFISNLSALKAFTIQFSNDESERAQHAYGVDGFAHMVIIGRDGVVVSVHSGYGEGVIDEIVEEVNASLRRVPGSPSTGAPSPSGRKLVAP